MNCFSPCFSMSKHKKKKLNSSTNIHSTAQGHEDYEAKLKPIESTTEKNLEQQLSCNEEKKTATTDENVAINHVVDDSTDAISEKIEAVNTDSEEFVEIKIERDDSGKETVVDDQKLVFQESSDSLFSISLDSKRQHGSTAELGDDVEVNSPMPMDKSKSCVHLVLNPIENLAHLDEKFKPKPKQKPTLKHQHQHNQSNSKENVNVNINEDLSTIPFCKEPSLKHQKTESKPNLKQNEEIAVDASLSSWLLEYETTPKSKSSSIKSENSLPKISLSLRSDGIPLIGTVGSYWSHAGQDSGSSSCKNVISENGNHKEVQAIL